MSEKPLVGIIMGSSSDWPTMEHAHKILEDFGVPHECKVVSAHRTPDLMNMYAMTAQERGLTGYHCRSRRSRSSPRYGCCSNRDFPYSGYPLNLKHSKAWIRYSPLLKCPAGFPSAL